MVDVVEKKSEVVEVGEFTVVDNGDRTVYFMYKEFGILLTKEMQEKLITFLQGVK